MLVKGFHESCLPLWEIALHYTFFKKSLCLAWTKWDNETPSHMARFYFQSLWAALQWVGFSETTELLPEKSNWSFFECKLQTLLILIKSMQLCKASFKCNISLKTDTTCYFSLTYMIVLTVIWINAFESYSAESQKSNRQQALASFRDHTKDSTVQLLLWKDWKSRFNFF